MAAYSGIQRRNQVQQNGNSSSPAAVRHSRSKWRNSRRVHFWAELAACWQSTRGNSGKSASLSFCPRLSRVQPVPLNNLQNCAFAELEPLSSATVQIISPKLDQLRNYSIDELSHIFQDTQSSSEREKRTMRKSFDSPKKKIKYWIRIKVIFFLHSNQPNFSDVRSIIKRGLQRHLDDFNRHSRLVEPYCDKWKTDRRASVFMRRSGTDRKSSESAF